MLSWNDKKEYDNIYAKFINYNLYVGKPDALLITYDTWANYSNELKDEIIKLKIDIWTTQAPYKLKIGKFEDIFSDL